MINQNLSTELLNTVGYYYKYILLIYNIVDTLL